MDRTDKFFQTDQIFEAKVHFHSDLVLQLRKKMESDTLQLVVGRFGIFAQPVRWLAESTPEDLADVIKCAFILHNLCIDMHVFDGDDDDGGGGEQRDWGLDENIETTRMVMTEYRTYFTDRFELTENRLSFRRRRQ
eukprot:g23942.t1